jgi:TRAP-type uncharacterized transport system fused permease subunit
MRQRDAAGDERTQQAPGHGRARDESESTPPLEELEPERAGRKLQGLPSTLVAAAGVALSLYALYWVFSPVPALQYRSSFLAVAMAMTFVVYRAFARRSAREERPDNPSLID